MSCHEYGEQNPQRWGQNFFQNLFSLVGKEKNPEVESGISPAFFSHAVTADFSLAIFAAAHHSAENFFGFSPIVVSPPRKTVKLINRKRLALANLTDITYLTICQE